MRPRAFPSAVNTSGSSSSRSGRRRAAHVDGDRSGADLEPEPLRVLIIEDEWCIAVAVQRALRSCGYAADEIVTSGRRALHAFERIDPGLVIVDIALDDGADGVELAERIRARSSVPIVFLSAHSDAATLQRVMRVRPQGFVVKPFTDAQLLTAAELAVHAEPAPPKIDPVAQRTLERIAALLVEAGHAVAPSAELPTDGVPGLRALSTREREILSRLLAHQCVGGIARTLSISEHTVRNHLKSVYAKLGVHSQEELLLLLTNPDAARRRRP